MYTRKLKWEFYQKVFWEKFVSLCNSLWSCQLLVSSKNGEQSIFKCKRASLTLKWPQSWTLFVFKYLNLNFVRNTWIFETGDFDHAFDTELIIFNLYFERVSTVQMNNMRKEPQKLNSGLILTDISPVFSAPSDGGAGGLWISIQRLSMVL